MVLTFAEENYGFWVKIFAFSHSKSALKKESHILKNHVFYIPVDNFLITFLEAVLNLCESGFYRCEPMYSERPPNSKKNRLQKRYIATLPHRLFCTFRRR